MRHLRVLSVLVAIYSIARFAVSGILRPLANFSGDFLASFPAWKVAVLTGRLDLYNGSLAAQWGPPPVWHYGPLEHLLTLPLFVFPTLRAAYVAWFFVNVAFVAVCAWLAARIIDDWLVVVLVFCNFNPLYEALTQRTIEIFELMLLFAAYTLYCRGRDAACGAAIGTAAMTKFLPLIFLPWFVLKGRWRALAAAVAVIVPVAIATQWILGWQNSGIVYQLVKVEYTSGQPNQSLSGMIARILLWTHANEMLVVPITRVLTVVCLTALCALMLRVRRRDDNNDLQFGLLAAAMVLLPPHNENYYFIFLLIPYLFLYARYRHQRQWSWRAALLALSFVLVAVPIPLTVVQRLTGLPIFRLYLQAGIPFVGAVLLAIVLVAEIGMSRALLTGE